MRFLLVLVIIIAAGAVLWSSWRVDRRLFAVTLVAVLAGVPLFIYGVWHRSENLWEPIDPLRIETHVTDARVMESGVRLTGKLVNHGHVDLARVSGKAVLLWCDIQPGLPCKDIDETDFQLIAHVRPGDTYQWSAMVSMPAQSLDEGNTWELDVTQADGYPADKEHSNTDDK